jgi:hypothetical protein
LDPNRKKQLWKKKIEEDKELNQIAQQMVRDSFTPLELWKVRNSNQTRSNENLDLQNKMQKLNIFDTQEKINL